MDHQGFNVFVLLNHEILLLIVNIVFASIFNIIKLFKMFSIIINENHSLLITKCLIRNHLIRNINKGGILIRFINVSIIVRLADKGLFIIWFRKMDLFCLSLLIK